MISMMPVMEQGYTSWDRALLPRDEFESRLRFVQTEMATGGFDVLAMWSLRYTAGEATFLSGWPHGGVLLVRAKGEPVLFSAVGSRDLYFARNQIWVEDVRPTGSGFGKAVRDELAGQSVAAGRIGIVGLEQMNAQAKDELFGALSAFELVDAGAFFAALRIAKRPREVCAVANSLDIANAAVTAGQAAFDAGATNVEAMVEAERAARRQRARDVRILSNLDGRHLRPFDRYAQARVGPFLLWVAVEHHGYWGEASNGGGRSLLAKDAVEAMIAATQAGTPSREVAQAGLSVLPEWARESAIQYGLGGGIGLEMDELPRIAPDSSGLLVGGAVLSLRTVIVDREPCIATACVRVGEEGAHRDKLIRL